MQTDGTTNQFPIQAPCIFSLLPPITVIVAHLSFLKSYMDCNCNNFQKWLETPDISDNVYKPFIRKSNFSGLRGNIRVTNVTFSSLERTKKSQFDPVVYFVRVRIITATQMVSRCFGPGHFLMTFFGATRTIQCWRLHTRHHS